MKPKVKQTDTKKSTLKAHSPKDYEREGILKRARKRAHTALANRKRRISNELKI